MNIRNYAREYFRQNFKDIPMTDQQRQEKIESLVVMIRDIVNFTEHGIISNDSVFGATLIDVRKK